MKKVSKYYLVVFSAVSVIVLGGLLAINYLSDPLFFFSEGNASNVASGYAREYKSWQVKYKKPQHLILGNSRNFFGFDVTKMGLTNVYNYSITGGQLADFRRQLASQLFQHKPESIILAIDTVCSNDLDENRTRFMARNWQEYLAAYWSRVGYLLSFQTTELSLESKSSFTYYDDYGLGVFFDKNTTTNNNVLKRVERREFRTFGPTPSLSYIRNRKEKEEICDTSELTELLSLAYESGIKTEIILNPIHVRYMSISYFLHYTSAVFVNMKDELVNINQHLAQKLNRHAFPIYDFRLVNSYTTEAFNFSENTESEYWYESSHYTPKMGNKMIEWIRSSPNERDLTFGIQLTPENVNSVIESEIEKLMKWNAENHFIEAQNL